MNNGGNGFRVRLTAVRRANPLYSPIQYGVVLVDGFDPEEFIEKIEDKSQPFSYSRMAKAYSDNEMYEEALAATIVADQR